MRVVTRAEVKRWKEPCRRKLTCRHRLEHNLPGHVQLGVLHTCESERGCQVDWPCFIRQQLACARDRSTVVRWIHLGRGKVYWPRRRQWFVGTRRPCRDPLHGVQRGEDRDRVESPYSRHESSS